MIYCNLRDSGIDSIGSIPWGTHISQLYSSKADFSDVPAPYIKSGLLNNELCIWIYSQIISRDELKTIIGECGVDVDEYIGSGQLRLIPHTEWYLEDNIFNEIRINRKWNELIRCALDSGFEGLRAVADTSWLEKGFFRTFANYEHNVNKIFSELPFLAICLYDVNMVDSFEVAEIIKNHTYVIIRHDNSLELIKNVELLIKDKQLEESEERYKKLIQLLPDSVFIHDERKIFYCNESAAHITGVKDHGELLEKSILELVSPESQYDFQRYIKETLEGNMDRNCLQSKFVCCNGEVKNIEIVSTGYSFHGYPALLSVIRDVTPLRKINELEKDIEKNKELLNNTLEYDKLKTEFLSNISHEFRTPLNVILSALQLLKSKKGQDCQSTKESKYLKIIQQNCFRLLRLVNNLIDITKIDSNYFEINPQNCDIVGLVERITMSVVEYAKNKDITILFNTNIEEKVIACDPDQIERIILNLLSNAIKFTKGSGNIWVTILNHEEKISISVKDSGIGIPPDKQESIFNRFQQVDKSLTRQYEGSGIGLSLVKALVEKHNGKITLNSEVGRGSEFIVEIPCRTLDEPKDKSGIQYNVNNYNNVERISIEFSDIYT